MIEQQLRELPTGELPAVQEIVAKLQRERSAQRKVLAAELCGIAKSTRTVDDFLREKHAAGDSW